MEKKKNTFGKKLQKFIHKFYLPLLLVVSIAFFSLTTNTFLTVHNLVNVFLQNGYLVVATMGIAMVMISGGVDLSVSYQIGLVSVIVGKLLQFTTLPVSIIILIGLAVGAFLGLLNGALTTSLRVHPLVSTLATMTIFQGVAYVFCGGLTFYGFPEAFKFIGQGYIYRWLPVSVIIVLVMFAIAYILLTKTYLGRFIYSLGGNAEASRLAGISTVKIRILSFVIAGIFIAVATMMLTSRVGTATPGIAVSAVFTCISACVLGGISFSGGSGSIPNMFLSVMILAILSNGMQLLGLSTYSQYIMKGVVLAGAIAFDNYQKRVHLKELANASKSTIKIAE